MDRSPRSEFNSLDARGPEFSRRSHWAAGQPIGDLMARTFDDPKLLSLAAGFVDQATLPHSLVRAAMESLLAEPDSARAALQYGTTEGSPQLRQALLDRLGQQDQSPPRASVSQVLVTAGSNQLLHLLCDTLANPDDIVLCAGPTYLVFLGIMQNIGAEARCVAGDEEGILPQALDAQLQQLDAKGELDRVKAVYVVSYFDNPQGVTMGLERRRSLVELLRRWSDRAARPILLIEDAAYRELRFEGPDIPSHLSLDPSGELVCYLGTFSKSFSPGLRIGFGVLPRAVARAVVEQKTNLDFGSPNFSQQLLERVLRLGLYWPHVERLCESYRSKRDAMVAALERHFGGRSEARWRRPAGGLYVWLELPRDVDTGPAGPLSEAAIAEGMIYVPGEYCYPKGAEQRNGMRLSFGVQSPDGIRQGIKMLANALKKSYGLPR